MLSKTTFLRSVPVLVLAGLVAGAGLASPRPAETFRPGSPWSITETARPAEPAPAASCSCAPDCSCGCQEGYECLCPNLAEEDRREFLAQVAQAFKQRMRDKRAIAQTPRPVPLQLAPQTPGRVMFAPMFAARSGGC